MYHAGWVLPLGGEAVGKYFSSGMHFVIGVVENHVTTLHEVPLGIFLGHIAKCYVMYCF